jgi:high-affinity iron transporter
VFLGLLGSAIVAYFINEISSMAEGMGQEMFNALILITAAMVIGWTVLWMRSNAPKMVSKLKKTGNEIKEGRLHMFSISVIIALAFLREGSEIILFGNGILLAGQIEVSNFSIGALLGLMGGTLIGGLLYFGLIKIPTKHIFKITSWLLIFLAAGMMSIAASYLVSAGVLDVLTQPVWDTSAILPDSSLPGRFLAGLIGYTAMPMGIQLVFYILTLSVLTVLSQLINRKSI